MVGSIPIGWQKPEDARQDVSGIWPVQLLDALCNKLLEPPQSTVMNAARFQVRDRVQKILRACAPVTASPGQNLCDLLGSSFPV